MKKDTTKGGIIIPEAAVAEPQGYGKVVSCGEAIKSISEGQVIVFHPMAGMDTVFETKIFKVLKYDEIYGILSDKEAIEQLESLTLSPKDQKVIHDA